MFTCLSSLPLRLHCSFPASAYSSCLSSTTFLLSFSPPFSLSLTCLHTLSSVSLSPHVYCLFLLMSLIYLPILPCTHCFSFCLLSPCTLLPFTHTFRTKFGFGFWFPSMLFLLYTYYIMYIYIYIYITSYPLTPNWKMKTWEMLSSGFKNSSQFQKEKQTTCSNRQAMTSRLQPRSRGGNISRAVAAKWLGETAVSLSSSPLS